MEGRGALTVRILAGWLHTSAPGPLALGEDLQALQVQVQSCVPLPFSNSPSPRFSCLLNWTCYLSIWNRLKEFVCSPYNLCKSTL